MRKFKFKSLRVKKFDSAPSQPDYSNVIRLNNTYFSLTGWLDLNSDISFILEEITEERLKQNPFLQSEYADFLFNEKLKKPKN